MSEKLWLERHQPELETEPSGAKARFDAGIAVGAIARRLYDPEGRGESLEVGIIGIEAVLHRSRELIQSARPIFEAGFSSDGALAFTDVMLPSVEAGSLKWRMVEVKSATKVMDCHREDSAIQAYIARRAGVQLSQVCIAHLDRTFMYAGEGSYRGLLREEDVTAEVLARAPEVQLWIAQASSVVSEAAEPKRETGRHCEEPFTCGFQGYCRSRESHTEYPVAWLPNIRTKALKSHIASQGVTDLRQVPDGLLNPVQRRVKTHTLSGHVYFDAQGAMKRLDRHTLPAFFLDFETINLAVPIWAGTRPYQQVTFQFSVHRVGRDGQLAHRDFLDLSGADPREALAHSLIEACEKRGPVYVYSSFEKARIRELAKHFSKLKRPLTALMGRLVDLRPIAERCYYHPSQEGSWSIKRVLPAVTGRGYEELDGVKDGGMAMQAYREAIDHETSKERKAAIDQELRRYCALDTEAMVRLWRVFSGKQAVPSATSF